MIPQNITDQIEDFLNGHLNQEEREVFEKALANDKNLQKEVAFKKLVIKGTKQSGKNDLKDRLKSIHYNYENENKSNIQTKKVQLWQKWIGIAASVAILITAGLFLFDNDKFNTQVAFEEYYQPVPLRLANRNVNVENSIIQLNEHYNNQEYDKALPFLQKLLAVDSNNTRMRLGAGICHLELNHLDSARAEFLPIIDAKDFRLQHQANWYMALTYMKEGNLDEVQKYLLPIINDSKADNYKQAVEIMKRLSSK